MLNWNSPDMQGYDEIDERGEFEVEVSFVPNSSPFYPYNPMVGYRNTRQQFPPGPPPNFIPQKNQAMGGPGFSGGHGGVSPLAIRPGQINFCLFKFTYIWQTNGMAYWAFLTRAGRNSVAGFRFRRGRWFFFGLDLRNIDSFICF